MRKRVGGWPVEGIGEAIAWANPPEAVLVTSTPSGESRCVIGDPSQLRGVQGLEHDFREGAVLGLLVNGDELHRLTRVQY